MKVVCFAKQKEKDSKIFCYPFIVPKKSLREERICLSVLVFFSFKLFCEFFSCLVGSMKKFMSLV